MAGLSWKRHVPEMLRSLRWHPPGPLDRADVQALFRVHWRRAIQLMRELGAVKGPNRTDPLLIDRDRLLLFLEEMERTGDGAALSEGRRALLESKLERFRLQRKTPFADFRIPAGRAAYGCRFDSLPAGIVFEPGRIVIEHAGAEDAFAKLFLLSQAAGNDLDAIVEAIEKTPASMTSGAA